MSANPQTNTGTSLDWTMLRAHFATRLKERIVLLEVTLSQLDAAPNAATRDTLERQFHSLAGIGGTYGFHDITDLAREGELLCSEGGNIAELRAIVEAIRKI